MVTTKVSLEFLQNLLSTSDPDVTLSDFKEAPGSGRGDNYTAMLYRVRLEGTRSVQSPEQQVSGEVTEVPWSRSIIYKVLPDSPARREAFKSEALFKNEVTFYNRILPSMLDFQNIARKDSGVSFAGVPKCYLARNDIVVLEDLRDRGFKMTDRKLGLNIAQCNAVLPELARFHALSLAMKVLVPEEFYELRSLVREQIFTNDNKQWYSGYYSAATKNALAMVRDALPANEGRPKYINRFREFIEPRNSSEKSFFDRMVDLIRPNEPLAVLCHGDCWSNNILFKHAENGRIIEVCLVDFQLVRYGSPALDLANLLYCCTSRNLRTKHLNLILRAYYNELCTALEDMDVLKQCFQSKEELWNLFEEEFRRCSRFGLGMALDMIPIATCDSDEAPDLYVSPDEDCDEEGDPGVPPKANDNCKIKMAELVQELVDNSII